MSLHGQKSILAKLMATENLRIMQQHTDTASFNVETRVLTVPILKNTISKNVYDLFMGHEVGHALFTPLEGMKKANKLKLNMSVANVVEDSRIERKIKDRYPGLKTPFIRAYNELYADNFFGTDDKDLNSLKFIDRINLHCKVGAALNIKFTDEELVLLNEVETTQTYDDVIEVCKKLKEYSKDEAKTAKKSSIVEAGGEISDEDAIEIDLTPEEMEMLDEMSDTDADFAKKTKELFNHDPNVVYKYADIPTFDIKRSVVDYKVYLKQYTDDGLKPDNNAYQNFKKESTKVVAYLVKEFEMRKNADQMKRAAVAKTGEMHMDKIYSYKFADDLFKKVTVVPGGKSHGLVMFLDWSGSMQKNLVSTVKQLLNLVIFCKMVNIPYEVYCFLDESKKDFLNFTENKANTMMFSKFSVINILSSRMSPKDYTLAAGALLGIASSKYKRPQWMNLNGTPLNEAILIAMDIVPEFQKKNRLQVVNTVFLTDGEGSDLPGIGGNVYKVDNAYTHLVLRDPITKNEELFERSKRDFMGMTPALLSLLRKRTNSHVVGMYICEDYIISSSMTDKMFPGKNKADVVTQFKKDHCVTAEQAGFDEYYLISASGMSLPEADLNIKEHSSVKTMITQFTKYTSNKVLGRVVLNRFIKLIS